MKNSDINNLLKLGLKNHQENNLDKAVYYYDEVIKENKENIKANLYLGVVFAQQRKFKRISSSVCIFCGTARKD